MIGPTQDRWNRLLGAEGNQPPRREGEGIAPKSTGGPADQLGVPLLVSLGILIALRILLYGT